ncbi:MAG: cytidine deaminase [Lachnospiraceae bacterium]|nr:cytidine deaminase [Lachnospiraceae bacterium]
MNCRTEEKQKIEELIDLAIRQLSFSYAPYSGFFVGAALECADGTIYGGCNIENASFGPSNCAERTAFFKAVSEGKRQFRRIAIVGGKDGKITEYCAPCGVCRQVMREFCGPDFEIILAKSKKEWNVYLLKDLLPESFGPEMLDGKK